jgi:hypothetical protein
VITLSCSIIIAGDARPNSGDGELRRIGESLLLSLVLESVLVVAEPTTTVLQVTRGQQLCFGRHLAADFGQVILTFSWTLLLFISFQSLIWFFFYLESLLVYSWTKHSYYVGLQARWQQLSSGASREIFFRRGSSDGLPKKWSDLGVLQVPMGALEQSPCGVFLLISSLFCELSLAQLRPIGPAN